jgi:hypothetical protein
MAKEKSGTLQIKSFGDHHVITQPNPLRKVLLRVPESEFGFPSAGAAAESLCRIIEHAPELDQVPAELIAHHINAIQAIVRERTKLDTAVVASKLSKQLRGVADEFLLMVNRDRPEHLEAILAPSIVPAE